MVDNNQWIRCLPVLRAAAVALARTVPVPGGVVAGLQIAPGSTGMRRGDTLRHGLGGSLSSGKSPLQRDPGCHDCAADIVNCDIGIF